MYRSLLTAAAMTMCLSAGAAAQDSAPPAGEPQPSVERAAVAPIATAFTLQPAAARPADRKRRPGMVGYIDDSTVTTQLRFRFDAGFGNNVPDRAEFFYAKCGCYRLDPPPAFDPEAPGPGPGVPTELNFQQFYAHAEYAGRDRMSLFAEIPFRAIQPQGFLAFGSPYDPFPDSSGIGDIRAGAKLALMSDEDTEVTVMFRASFPTGNAGKGLSTDTVNIEPALLFQRSVTDRFGIEGQIGTWHPFGGSRSATSDDDKFSGNVLFYGIGPSFDLVTTDRVRFSPIAELVGWRVFGGSQTSCTLAACTFETDDNIVNLKLGARTTVNGRHSFYAGFGWALTEAKWYDKIWRLEYRVGL